MTNSLLYKSSIIQNQLRTDIPDFKPGSIVEVHYKISEDGKLGEKYRIQIFKGLVIVGRGTSTADATFTVLKDSTAAIKVQRTFPLNSPWIEKIVLTSDLQRGSRAKLYYTKNLKSSIKGARTKKVRAKEPITN